MMNYLYIDSSHDLEFGIYDLKQRVWIDFKKIAGAQNSKILHHEIYTTLESHKMQLSKVKALIINSGPGSYTGMRLTEGMAQILEWQKLPVFSFYHFQVPAIFNIQNYFWVSTAFKGEWFIYWSGDSSTKLIKEVELADFVAKNRQIYTHFDIKKLGLLETSNMVFKNFDQLINYVHQKSMRESVYYFREAEVEFKTINQNERG
jgi:tRNA threonylcarbamoyladenosine biosynthesis protein TsaB